MTLQCLAATAVIMGPLVVTVLLIAEVGTRWGELVAFLGVIPISLADFLFLELVAGFAADISRGNLKRYMAVVTSCHEVFGQVL